MGTHIYPPPAGPAAPYPAFGVPPFSAPDFCTTRPVGDFLPYATQGFNFTGTIYPSTTISAMISHSGNADFSKCQPTGWETKMTDGAVYSSPGVCPHNWAATQSTVMLQSTKSVTGAWCCKTGDSYHADGDWYAHFLAPIPSFPHACRSLVYSQSNTILIATLTEGAEKGKTTELSEGVFFYPAMRIEWEASDITAASRRSTFTSSTVSRTDYAATATQSPTDIYISTPSPTPSTSTESLGSGRSSTGVLVGIPIFSAFFIGLAIWFFWHRRVRNRDYNSRLQTAGLAMGSRLPPSVYPVPLPRPATPPPAPAYEPPAPGSNVHFDPPPPAYLHPAAPPTYKEI